jgi:hypothetical protein
MGDEHDFGYMSGQMDAMKDQISVMHSDLESLKGEVHQIGLIVAEMRTELKALSRRQSPGEIVYAFLMFGAAGAGLWFGKIEPWLAGAGVLAGAIILQRGRLDKMVAGYISRKSQAVETVKE